MARGPKPKPAAVQRQRGSSRRPIGEDAPAAAEAGGPIAAPDFLDGEALQIWRDRAPLLAQLRLLTAADTTAFGRYCRNLALWLKMRRVLDDDGETYSVETASGLVFRPRPEFMIADRVERQLLAAEDRFGMNPAERQRIYAARAAGGGKGDLFPEAPRREDDLATRPAAPEPPGPLGLLN